MSARSRVARALGVGVLVAAPLLFLRGQHAVAAPETGTVTGSASGSGSAAPTVTSLAASLAAPSASASGAAILEDPGATMRAYEAALAQAKLAGPAYATDPKGTPYTPDEVHEVIEAEQQAFIAGRLSEVIAVLTGMVESPRFSLAAREPEGRAAWLLLGDALSQSGVHALARVYLRKAATGPVAEGTARSAARKLTEIALDDEAYEQGILDLQPILEKAPTSAELRGELDYLVGRLAESEDDVDTAMKAYAKIVPLSRFWSAATYRRGLLEVDRSRLNEAEALFCQVADPKRQDTSAPVFADERFFAVRDLARLALGRVAHENKRFDDARYYYYLVQQDSKRLAEALYESATTQYEKEDYDGARDALDELSTLGEGHVYDDEARVLDVYVDIAVCDFKNASIKLDAFLRTYTPLRDRVHALATGPDLGIRAFLDRGAAIEAGGSTGTLDNDARIWRRLEADPALLFILRARRRLASELAGLRGAAAQLDGLAATIGGKTTSAAIDPESLSGTSEQKAEELRAAIAALRSELAGLEKAGAPPQQVAALKGDVEALSDKAAALDAEMATAPAVEGEGKGGPGLPGLVAGDQSKAKSLLARGIAIMGELDLVAQKLAREALVRLDKRASRLVARARLAKIDVVLGEKRGLETEVEGLRNGILPKDALDSINAGRYLDDNEEYWPFEGDEWVDEVIGVEIGER